MKYLSQKDLVIPRRPQDTHKGDFGRVLVIGGSKEFVGAVALAGVATLRTGVDLVIVAAPEKTAWAISCLSPDLITMKFKGNHFSTRHIRDMLRLINKMDAVLIGNGIGQHQETQDFIKSIIKKINKPIVIDADGIKAVPMQDLQNAIITPHSAELKILFHNSGIFESPESAIAKTIIKEKNPIKKGQLLKKLKIKNKIFKKFLEDNNILLLKGPVDIIIGKDKMALNKTGNPGLTKGGTGDVLAGLCLGYYTLLKDGFQAACNAAFINGTIADALKQKKGYTYIASDLIRDKQYMANILKKIR